MRDSGKVVAGDFNGGSVSRSMRGGLVVWAGLKRRELNSETVLQWTEVDAQWVSRGRAAMNFAKDLWSGEGALGFSPASGHVHTVRLDWADGRRSVIKFEEELFRHFEITLEERRLAASQNDGGAPSGTADADVIEKLTQLAALRDSGVLTEEEFETKKRELLGRI